MNIKTLEDAMYVLILYITGYNSKANRIIDQLRTTIDNDFKDKYSLKIVNLLENPQLAEEHDVFATPTVVKVFPLPMKKILGDLSNKEKVLYGLGLIKDLETCP